MKMERSETHQKGLALLNRLHGGQAGETLVENLKDICPDFVDMTIEWAIQGIMARPGLDLLTREYLLIASCTTLGHPVPQLKAHIDAALNLGGSREQIVEVILQMVFYAGGAAVSNALSHAKEVFDNTSTINAGCLILSCRPGAMFIGFRKLHNIRLAEIISSTILAVCLKNGGTVRSASSLLLKSLTNQDL